MKVGILGAGGIARKMAKTLNKMDRASAYAIGSRSIEKAQAFAKDFGIGKAYGSYEALLSDPEVQLVYVATPHSHHAQHIELALEHGKPVLCEKAFTVNAKQAKKVIDLAKKKHLLLAEAIWTRYVPMRNMLDEVVQSGIIGEITSLTANLGYAIDTVPRLMDPNLAGGALLDVGVYTINFMSMVLGDDFSSFDASAVMTETGVDGHNSLTFTYPDGKIAILHSSQHAITDRRGMLFGTKGFIEVVNINNPEKIWVFDSEYQLVKEIVQPQQITGFEYQVEACIDAIEAGAMECPQMPHDEILRIMGIMDDVRARWGLKYPNE